MYEQVVTLVTHPFVYIPVLAFLTLYIVIAPVVIHLILKMKANPDLKVIDFEQIDLPFEVESHFAETGKQLQQLGFDFLNGIAMPSPVSSTSMVLQYWVNTSHKTSAVSMVVFSDTGQKIAPGTSPITEYKVSFSTDFMDGSSLESSNAKQTGAFPIAEHRRVYNLYWINELAKIYQFHEACRQDLELFTEADHQIASRYHWDARAELSESMQKEYEYACQTGFLKLNARGDLYRTTLKGCTLLTWNELPPLLQLNNWKARRKVIKKAIELDVVNYLKG